MYSSDSLAWQLSNEQFDKLAVLALVTCVACTACFLWLALKTSHSIGWPAYFGIAMLAGTVIGLSSALFVVSLGNKMGIFYMPSSTFSDTMAGVYTFLAVGPAAGTLILGLLVLLERRLQALTRSFRRRPTRGPNPLL